MITGLLHTRNRPGFLMRAIGYYDGKIEHPVLVLDASDAEHRERIQSGLLGLRLTYPLQVMLHSASTPMYERLGDALLQVLTPYVMLMADDDLYYTEWMKSAVAFLDSNSSVGTVYGHTVIFQLTSYEPFGALERFLISAPNPVARWLEQETPAERLLELGKGPWTTTGWYSIQRTSILREIVSAAQEARLDADMFERTLNLLQPIYGKVVMLDSVYVARQIDPNQCRKPSTFKANEGSLAKLREIGRARLVQHASINTTEAERIVDSTMRAEILQLKRNDARERLCIPYWKSKLRPIQGLVTSLKGLPQKLSQVDPLAPDARFPANPLLTETHTCIQILRSACASGQ
ncbi:MAG: TIGR00180 family glycosyltransferase [Gemmatimonadota bacterium]|nr:TIGR00180 family glycosyltransferase [Gemmatimonadota bacterium]